MRSSGHRRRAWPLCLVRLRRPLRRGAAAKPDPAAPYLGMSQAEIVACAGEPHSPAIESGAEAETLTYQL